MVLSYLPATRLVLGHYKRPILWMFFPIVVSKHKALFLSCIRAVLQPSGGASCSKIYQSTVFYV